MFEKFTFKKQLSKEENVEKLLDVALLVCKDIDNTSLIEINLCDYVYSPDEAIEELGLDEELINQLLEDYVIQVIKAINSFEKFLKEFKKTNKSELDYITFKDLAHKNLGVARNLRVKDAEKLLYILMKENDLEYLEVSIKALKACSIKLKPRCAYDTLNLMKIKSTF